MLKPKNRSKSIFWLFFNSDIPSGEYDKLALNRYFKVLLAYDAKRFLQVLTECDFRVLRSVKVFLNQSLMLFLQQRAKTSKIGFSDPENEMNRLYFMSDTSLLLRFLMQTIVEKPTQIWEAAKRFLLENEFELSYKLYLSMTGAFLPRKLETFRRILINIRVFFAVFDDDDFDIMADTISAEHKRESCEEFIFGFPEKIAKKLYNRFLIEFASSRKSWLSATVHEESFSKKNEPNEYPLKNE